MHLTSSRAFTLLELVLVLLLVSLVSLVAAPRLFSRDSISAFVAQERAISLIRQVQLARMQSNLTESELETNSHYVLVIWPQCLGSVAACNPSDLEPRSDRLKEDGLSFTSNAPSQQVTFDLLGNPPQAVNIQIDARYNSSQAQVCINTQGFVSAGVCQ